MNTIETINCKHNVTARTYYEGELTDIEIPYNHDLTKEENHKNAAIELVKKGWVLNAVKREPVKILIGSTITKYKMIWINSSNVSHIILDEELIAR